jgi:hypothetical protein
VQTLYYKLFVSKTFTRHPTVSFIRWKLLLSDLCLTVFMLFTSLAIVALGYQAPPSMVRTVISRSVQADTATAAPQAPHPYYRCPTTYLCFRPSTASWSQASPPSP